MILGLVGTGKTTLLNYLNDVPLKCVFSNNKWVLEVESENFTLPGNFTIGHRTEPETLYPNVYTPKDRQYSFIDNPGFRDEFAIKKAREFFREQIT